MTTENDRGRERTTAEQQQRQEAGHVDASAPGEARRNLTTDFLVSVASGVASAGSYDVLKGGVKAVVSKVHHDGGGEAQKGGTVAGGPSDGESGS